MVKLILPALLVLPMFVSAQPDLKEIGLQLEQSGKRRNAALVATAMTVGVCFIAAKTTQDATPVLAVGVIGGGIAIGLNISANNKEKQAGRLLQY